MRSQVILASGGLDSFLVWALHAPRAVNLFVDIGHKYAAKERAVIINLADKVPGFVAKVINGPDLGHLELPSGIIPLRNAHLILLAAQYGEDILLGVLRDEINSDKSPEFLDAMGLVLQISHRPQYWNNNAYTTYHLGAPLSGMTKTEAVAQYLQAGKPEAWLHETVSCYDADVGHCGACPSCFKRWVAFVNTGVEPRFRSAPEEWAERMGVLRKVYDGTYPEARANEIKEALKRVR